MKIEQASEQEIYQIAKLDRHISSERLSFCIKNGFVYVLKDHTSNDEQTVGVLRYSLFWQSIPFLDMLIIEPSCRGKGLGREMMSRWENDMKRMTFRHVMTSTQADEDAWRFYEKLGYRKVGGFFPPEQEAEELIYLKVLEN